MLGLPCRIPRRLWDQKVAGSHTVAPRASPRADSRPIRCLMHQRPKQIRSAKISSVTSATGAQVRSGDSDRSEVPGLVGCSWTGTLPCATCRIARRRDVAFCDVVSWRNFTDHGFSRLGDILCLNIGMGFARTRNVMSACFFEGKSPLSIGVIPPSPGVVDQYYIDSTGEGDDGRN